MESPDESRDSRMTRRPDPDPTEATAALVASAIGSLKEYFVTRVNAMDRAQTIFHEDLTRVPTSLDKGLATARDYSDAQSQRLIEHSDYNYKLNTERFALQAEKFKAMSEIIEVLKTSVNERFQLGDIQTEKAARDVKSAVDAAFAAAKEAVGEQNKSNALAIAKSETGFTKQIDQLADSVKSIVKNTDDKISDLKERVLASEGKVSISDPATAIMLRDLAAQVARLSDNANIHVGRDQQVSDNSSKLFSVLAVVIAVAGLLLNAFLSHGAGAN